MQGIYVDTKGRSAIRSASLVLQYSRHLCSIDWGVDLPVDAVKFGVTVFKTSMLN